MNSPAVINASDHTGVLLAIPCLNEQEHLDALVRRLVADTADLTRLIVIIDGNSSDRTPEIARNLAREFPDAVTYLHNPDRLQSAGINRAVAAHGGSMNYLIRLDAHAGYPADFCQTLLEEAGKTGAASVVVPMHTVGEKGFQRAAAAAQNSVLGNGGAAHRNVATEGRWVEHGHHALMRIDAFQAVGGYDASFSHNEDAELDLRLRQAGYRIWLTARTSIDYYPRRTPHALLQQYMKFGHGRARTILKHRIIPRLRQMIPVFVLPAAALALLTPFCWLAIVPVLIWAVTCLGYGVRLARQAGEPGLWVSGPAAMIMHLGWSFGFWRGMLTGGKPLRT